MKHIDALHVVCASRAVGKLAQGPRGKIYFQYAPTWLETGFDLAPGRMPFEAAPQLARDPLFASLHGVFNDSLPDGWGLLLMDRAFRAKCGFTRGEITPLDRLAYVGERAMGALEYHPATWDEAPAEAVNIATLADEAYRVLKGSDGDVLPQLRILGGSPGGARPKVLIARAPLTGECRAGFLELPHGFEHWLVKFRANEDALDMGRVERVYAEMAANAGVAMEVAELIETRVGENTEAFFATKRFDRVSAQKRAVLSLSGYLYADHRTPSVDYDTLLGATMKLTQDINQVRRAYRLAVFNVLAHNKDDHAKNFAFIYFEENRQWRLSPAFDLTFAHGIAGEHTTAVNGIGNPARKDLLRLAADHRIANADAIIDEVRASIATWSTLAQNRAVMARTITDIQRALRGIDSRFAGV